MSKNKKRKTFVIRNLLDGIIITAVIVFRLSVNSSSGNNMKLRAIRKITFQVLILNRKLVCRV